jgi:DEAD/DEAH box helicase domain-containing protein
MIPSVLAHQVRHGVKDFLRTTFPIATPHFHQLLENLLEREDGLFQGPYLSINLPFRQGKGGPDFFPYVPLKFPPYLHQEEAFNRLSGAHSRSTIVATGTGSGKTECFLHPILDMCRQHRGEPGIKAIVIYPMNALATDQAGRLAEIIWSNPNLKGSVTAGLFAGQSEREPRTGMGPDGIVTNKETLRLKPPDILLTNYKMLDYLLIRAKDLPLWKQNGPETLRFLVVDELHTFDGAQGTDLACLLRRLKARLKTPVEHLCCVGTSATLGSNEEKERLIHYAREIFGEPFDNEAVINESRLSAGEYLAASFVTGRGVVAPERASELDPEVYDGYEPYIRAQCALWFGETDHRDPLANAEAAKSPPAPLWQRGENHSLAEVREEEFHEPGWRVTLGERIKGHYFFQNLLKALDGRPKSYKDILEQLEQVTPEFRGLPRQYREDLLNSLLALVSEARAWSGDGLDRQGKETHESPQKAAPFLQVRVQLWLRELRRMVGEVSSNPVLNFADDLNEEQLKQHLPVVNCRSCGSTAWAALKRQKDTSISGKLEDFYLAFFGDDPKVTFLFPEEPGVQVRPLETGVALLCTGCLNLTERLDLERCPSCSGCELIRVYISNQQVNRGNGSLPNTIAPIVKPKTGSPFWVPRRQASPASCWRSFIPPASTTTRSS